MRWSRWSCLGPSALTLYSALAGCGDLAVDGSYEGEVLFEVRGLLCALGPMDSTTSSVGFLWTTLTPDATRLGVTPGEAHFVDAPYLPADFRVDLYETPPASVRTAIRVGDEAYDVAIGIPVLFEDTDQSGSLQPSERVLGVGRGHVVLHVRPATERANEVSLELLGLPTGFTFAQTRCDGPVLTGFESLPATTRIDVWIFDGVPDNPLEPLAPTTCLAPF